ncbi:ERAD-associated E3 ubiquitin-protein ligase doa10 [Hypsizygus marmoreus]|uniref:RING-type E3 ubiquitin transferase n=1 Tax=Hypsizygus marmoreus TaxID=39966 RepID=A0A369J1J8_HYPMA|nr:ERAD-associated E3 ubiquitin-protein ligase doa10 [Hypsizygus marmoreus]
MQEAEEQDTCRICSAPAEADQPLFHPCKCSGTIRYIHQDCLTTWLAHSKKKNCDVCKHPYSFTKVYAPDMPSTLPPILLIRRLLQQAVFGLLFGLRAMGVALIWLAALPWATVWTWRMYFSMGDSTAWWISDRPRPAHRASPFYYSMPPEPSANQPETFMGRLTTHPAWIALSADIFTGQIIASLIVLTFVAVFLLREWISQNARPGVFEDEDLPEENPAPAAAQPQPQVQPGNIPLDEALAQRQIETLRALDALRARDGVNGHMVGDARIHGRSPIERSRKKGKSRQLAQGHVNPFDAEPRTLTRRRLHPGSPVKDLEMDPEDEHVKRKSFSRRVFAARLAGARRKAASGPPPLPAAPIGVNPMFEFTFKADSQAPESSGKQQTESAPIEPDNSFFPRVALQPPKGTLAFSFDRAKSSSSSPTPSTSPEDQTNLPSSSSTTSLNQAQARRPPLPTTSVPPLWPAFSSTSPVRTPMDSPSLATYRPPEELEGVAGPSRIPNYFAHNEARSHGEEEDENRAESVQRAFQADYDKFFAKPPDYDEVFGREGSASPSNNKGRDNVDENGDEVTNEIDVDDREGSSTDDDTDQDDDEEADDDDEEDEDEDDDEEDDEEDAENEEAGDAGDMEDILFGALGVDGQQAQANAAGAPDGAAAANQAQAPENQAGAAEVRLELNEEIEGNVEDDMEGAMEAIGMRGPIYGVFQNAALMIFVLDTAIGLGIWIPYTIGKSTALLSLNPPRFLQILHLPIRAIRIVTDPIVDTIAFFVVELVLPPFGRLLRNSAALFVKGLVLLAQKLLGQKMADSISNISAKMESRIIKLSNSPLERILAWSSAATKSEAVSKPFFLEERYPDLFYKGELYFALIGKYIRLTMVRFQATWSQLALGDGPAERTFAILLGYAVASLILAIYLNLLTIGHAKTAGRAVRSAVRQQLLVLKVATFIFIELVTFPLSCGLVLDLCTVWLFPEANFASRVAFFVQAPLTATFYHWVAGTMFMYTFAVLLSSCRSVMRKGAMWFIKDPQDQNSHPIRDILDRPTLTQLRKICVSGVMYSCVVACVVGSVASLLLLGNKSIMPFRWKNREPLSNVPIDLLFLHLVLPYTMQYFRPKKALREFATVVWKVLAKKLRLTSYFFGGLHPDEERPSPMFSLRSTHPLPDADSPKDGTFRRVPATDNLALPRDMRATVQVTPDGQPFDEAARALMNLQNAEIEKAKRNVKDEFIVVYIPPLFRYRVICFIALFWMVGAVMLGAAVALPIQLGRSFFELFTTRDVHDGYSLIVGFYLLWGCYLVGTAIDRIDKRRQRIAGEQRGRAKLPMLVIKRGAVWIMKVTYLAVCLGVIIPTLISFVIDLYIILPIRFTLDPGMTPRIRVVDTWALGLLYAKIALHANRIQPPNRITRGIQRVIANGWMNPAPVQATREVIGPVMGGLVGMIVFPGAVFRAVQYLLPNIPVDDKFMFMHVYPGIFMFAGLARSGVVLYALLKSWSQSIRDKEFLVEMRLRNHEPEKVNMMESEGVETTAQPVVNGVGREDGE